MAPQSKRAHGQTFMIAKGKRTREIMEKNRRSGSLLCLPGELRNHIWGYVLGYQLIHVREEQTQQNLGPGRPNSRMFHTLCDSPVTEKQAWELSRDPAYENVVKEASTILAQSDMRHCHHRHATCYKVLRNGSIRRLHIDILYVCRQIYLEAMRLLWGTNTWSIDDFQSFHVWFNARNRLQRSLVKKMHLGSDIVIAQPPQYLVLKFSMLTELYTDVTINCREALWCRPFFRSKRIFVICSGSGENTDSSQNWLSDIATDDNCGTTVRERIEKADMWCARLFEWGEATTRLRLKNENKKALRWATMVKRIGNGDLSGNSDQQERKSYDRGQAVQWEDDVAHA